MSGSLKEAMGGISLDDITVAPDGKVQIANPHLAARISALKAGAPARSDFNIGCTTNSGCGHRPE